MKRFSLPLPPEAFLPGLHELSREELERLRDELLKEREQHALELEVLEARIDLVRFSLCGPPDYQDVEQYVDGSRFGVTRQFVDQHQGPIGQMRWRDLTGLFNGAGDSPGAVSGRQWTTGALIAPNLFLTAGHSFDQKGGGLSRPKRNGKVLPSGDLARLMDVVFNYQTGSAAPEQSFPVVSLREYRCGNVDYAIVELGPDADGRAPGTRFGTLTPAAQDLTMTGAVLCLIQHPDGPKKIDAGPMVGNVGGRIAYKIDTTPGSSGSPLLSYDSGEIVGVHTKGGCANDESGANSGAAIGAIRAASALL